MTKEPSWTILLHVLNGWLKSPGETKVHVQRCSQGAGTSSSVRKQGLGSYIMHASLLTLQMASEPLPVSPGQSPDHKMQDYPSEEACAPTVLPDSPSTTEYLKRRNRPTSYCFLAGVVGWGPGSAQKHLCRTQHGVSRSGVSRSSRAQKTGDPWSDQ